MTVEELDLARAKDAAFARALRSYPASFMAEWTAETWWSSLGPVGQLEWRFDARAIRLGDEARGLRVVPATPINKVREAMDAAKGKSATSPEYFAVSFALSEMTVAMLAASPFAPEEKE